MTLIIKIVKRKQFESKPQVDKYEYYFAAKKSDPLTHEGKASQLDAEAIARPHNDHLIATVHSRRPNDLSFDQCPALCAPAAPRASLK